VHGARHVAAADRSVGTARTRRETDDHPLRAAGAEAAGPKPKREAIPLSDSYGTGQSRAPRRRPRAGPRRRVYPYVYNMLWEPPPLPRMGSDLRTSGEKTVEPVTRPVLPPFNARPVSNIFSTSTVRSSPAHHRHRSHSRVSRADKGTEGGRRLRPSQHRCSLLSLSSLDVNAPCCTRSRSRRHLARLGLARGGGSGVVAVAAAHPTVHVATVGAANGAPRGAHRGAFGSASGLDMLVTALPAALTAARSDRRPDWTCS
jgi:hypothetical protein